MLGIVLLLGGVGRHALSGERGEPRSSADGRASASPRRPIDGRASASPRRPIDGRAAASARRPGDGRSGASPRGEEDRSPGAMRLALGLALATGCLLVGGTRAAGPCAAILLLAGASLLSVDLARGLWGDRVPPWRGDLRHRSLAAFVVARADFAGRPLRDGGRLVGCEGDMRSCPYLPTLARLLGPRSRRELLVGLRVQNLAWRVFGGLGLFLLLRRRGLGALPCALAGVGWTSSFSAPHLEQGGIGVGWAMGMLPLVLWAWTGPSLIRRFTGFLLVLMLSCEGGAAFLAGSAVLVLVELRKGRTGRWAITAAALVVAFLLLRGRGLPFWGEAWWGSLRVVAMSGGESVWRALALPSGTGISPQLALFGHLPILAVILRWGAGRPGENVGSDDDPLLLGGLLTAALLSATARGLLAFFGEALIWSALAAALHRVIVAERPPLRRVVLGLVGVAFLLRFVAWGEAASRGSRKTVRRGSFVAPSALAETVPAFDLGESGRIFDRLAAGKPVRLLHPFWGWRGPDTVPSAHAPARHRAMTDVITAPVSSGVGP